MTPLTPDDVAEVIVFVATRPSHVNLAETVVLPTDQASATNVHRADRGAVTVRTSAVADRRRAGGSGDSPRTPPRNRTTSD